MRYIVLIVALLFISDLYAGSYTVMTDSVNVNTSAIDTVSCVPTLSGAQVMAVDGDAWIRVSTTDSVAYSEWIFLPNKVVINMPDILRIRTFHFKADAVDTGFVQIIAPRYRD